MVRRLLFHWPPFFDGECFLVLLLMGAKAHSFRSDKQLCNKHTEAGSRLNVQHYFYNVLEARYTIPEGYSVINVPMVCSLFTSLMS